MGARKKSGYEEKMIVDKKFYVLLFIQGNILN